MKKFNEIRDNQILTEDLGNLNKAYQKVRRLYISGRKYNAREWITVLSDILDEID